MTADPPVSRSTSSSSSNGFRGEKAGRPLPGSGPLPISSPPSRSSLRRSARAARAEDGDSRSSVVGPAPPWTAVPDSLVVTVSFVDAFVVVSQARPRSGLKSISVPRSIRLFMNLLVSSRSRSPPSPSSSLTSWNGWAVPLSSSHIKVCSTSTAASKPIPPMDVFSSSFNISSEPRLRFFAFRYASLLRLCVFCRSSAEPIQLSR
mmetsp:Transcript_12777/g.31051  ORF Transcript_12777/g.31051 Transcript_12777/m.31051 type:complete len:205 (-) Transcript_12777:811-1425(-)